jgi:hypothetical protein
MKLLGVQCLLLGAMKAGIPEIKFIKKQVQMTLKDGTKRKRFKPKGSDYTPHAVT